MTVVWHFVDSLLADPVTWGQLLYVVVFYRLLRWVVARAAQ